MGTLNNNLLESLLDDFELNMLLCNKEMCKIQNILIQEYLIKHKSNLTEELRCKASYYLSGYQFIFSNDFVKFNVYYKKKKKILLSKTREDLSKIIDLILDFRSCSKSQVINEIYEIFPRVKNNAQPLEKIDLYFYEEIISFLMNKAPNRRRLNAIWDFNIFNNYCYFKGDDDYLRNAVILN